MLTAKEARKNAQSAEVITEADSKRLATIEKYVSQEAQEGLRRTEFYDFQETEICIGDHEKMSKKLKQILRKRGFKVREKKEWREVEKKLDWPYVTYVKVWRYVRIISW